MLRLNVAWGDSWGMQLFETLLLIVDKHCGQVGRQQADGRARLAPHLFMIFPNFLITSRSVSALAWAALV